MRDRQFPRWTIWLITAFVLVPSATVLAQTEFSGIPEPGSPVFWADYAVFWDLPTNESRVEIAYKVPNPNLTYIRRGDQYIASYEINALIRDDDNPQVTTASHKESYAVSTFRETRSRDSYLVNKLEVTVPPGSYQLEVRIRDVISDRKYLRTSLLTVPDYAGRDYSLSSPLYCAAPPEETLPARFQKYGQPLLPKVTRAYGAAGETVPIYLEAYTPEDTTVQMMLLADSFHRFQDYTRHDTLRFTPAAENPTPLILNIPIGEFRPGEVELTLTLLADGQTVVEELKSSYRIEWSLQAMMGQDWETVVDQLVHIGEPKEIRALRDADEEDRLSMFKAFWKAKDPTPDTPENEWKNEYYRRIRFADAHYTNPYRRGWKTDFGMVYIKYGEPDQIERYPFELGQKPYEIWYYYSQGRKFVFVDSKGNDDYQLQYPYDGIER